LGVDLAGDGNPRNSVGKCGCPFRAFRPDADGDEIGEATALDVDARPQLFQYLREGFLFAGRFRLTNTKESRDPAAKAWPDAELRVGDEVFRLDELHQHAVRAHDLHLAVDPRTVGRGWSHALCGRVQQVLAAGVEE